MARSSQGGRDEERFDLRPVARCAKDPAAFKAQSQSRFQSLFASKLTERAATLEQLADGYGIVLSKADLKDLPINLKVDEGKLLFNGDDNLQLRRLKTQVDAVKASHPGAPPRAMAMEDAEAPITPKIFKRGNPGTPGDEVPRRFLAILSPDDRQPFKNGSGRLELAQAIASKDNPLTARVMVNRVWQEHFGYGLVRTPSDFGTRGERPTHPELLDYLAVAFVKDGWSLKKLHRQIMLSATYQQSSREVDAGRRKGSRESPALPHEPPAAGLRSDARFTAGRFRPD